MGMSKLKSLLFTFNLMTGRNRRHNKSLHDVTEWSNVIQNILTEFDLYEEEFNLDTMLEDIGKVRLEIIRILYRSHEIIKIARKVKGANVFVNEIIGQLEDFRRYLDYPYLNRSKIINSILEVQNSLSHLKDVISEIEYK